MAVTIASLCWAFCQISNSMEELKSCAKASH
jgi:hypothetical protein